MKRHSKLITNSGDGTSGNEEGCEQFVRVLLYTSGGLCNKFFNGIAPTNLYRENSTRMMIERYIRQICRFNVFLDAVVTKCEVPSLTGSTLSATRTKDKQTVLRLVSCRLKPLVTERNFAPQMQMGVDTRKPSE